MKRYAVVAASASAVFAFAAGPAAAFHCTNLSKPVGAGSKGTYDVVTDAFTITNPGWEKKFATRGFDGIRGGFVTITAGGTALGDTYAHPHGEVPNAEHGSQEHGTQYFD